MPFTRFLIPFTRIFAQKKLKNNQKETAHPNLCPL